MDIIYYMSDNIVTNPNGEILKVHPNGEVEVFLHEPEHVARIGLLAHQYYIDAMLYEKMVDYVQHCVDIGVDVTKLAAPGKTIKETLKIRVAATMAPADTELQ